MKVKMYIGIIGDCTLPNIPTYLLRGGRYYPSRVALRQAAKRWENRHPKHVLVETRCVMVEVEATYENWLKQESRRAW